MSSYLFNTKLSTSFKKLPCGVCNPILYMMGQNDPFPHQQLFSLEQYHCGETVTIIAVTIIQDGGRRRRWVRAGPDCDAYTKQCALFFAHNTRASTVLVLRVMLCKSAHLFLKYGMMKLSWYDCNFRLSCLPSFLPLISPDTDPILIRNLPLSRKKMQMFHASDTPYLKSVFERKTTCKLIK